MMKNDYTQHLTAISQALSASDNKAYASAMTEFALEIQNNTIKEARQLMGETDAKILASRGVRQLTSEETTFWNSCITALKSAEPKQAISNLDITIPETIVEAVFEEMVENHPLLEAISVRYVPGNVKMILNASDRPKAHWGPLNSAIINEISAGLTYIDTGIFKIYAPLIIHKDMLELGAPWIDRFARTYLAEAMANAYENAAINGTGKNEPIGMIKDISASAAVVNGVYPDKEKVELLDLSPVSTGAMLAELSVNSRGITRSVSNVILACNPLDYWSKIFPATTPKAADGTYRNDILPYPIKICQSAYVPVNSAIIGIGKKYVMFVSGGSLGGKVEFTDDARFFEDDRSFKVKAYGNGRAYDNKDFLYCDITNMKSVAFPVFIEERAELGMLSLSASAGTASGTTAITVSTAKQDSSNTYKYKVGVSSIPVVGTTPTGYTTWDGSTGITAASGAVVAIVELDSNGKVVSAGYVNAVTK